MAINKELFLMSYDILSMCVMLNLDWF